MTTCHGPLLTRALAIEALSRLGAQLARNGLVGDVYLVGGAAMVLAYDADRMTRDIDAVFAPTEEVYRAARVVAADLRLPVGWLNDAAKGYVPGADPSAIKVLEVPGLRVTAASPEFLLGMKLLAARPEQDREDIARLAGLLDLQTRDEVFAVVERLYPPTLVLPRTRFLVEEMFPSAKEPPGAEKPILGGTMKPRRSGPRTGKRRSGGKKR